MSALFPEYYLIKVNRFNDVARDTLDEWIYFLKNEEIRSEFTARGLLKAKEQLDILKLPEAERLAYERYKDDLHYQASMVESTYGHGKMEGRKEGRQEGRQEGKSEMLTRQLQRRFGDLPPWATEKIAKAEPPYLEEWSLRILDAPTLESVLADLS